MNHKKRKISAVLGVCSLFSSLGYAREKTELKQELLKVDSKTNDKLEKNIQKQKNDNSIKLGKIADNSNLGLKIVVGLLSAATLAEGIYILKQHNDVNDALDDAYTKAKNLENAEKEIEDKQKIINHLISNSNAFAKLKDKYTFVHQLGHGRQGSSAIFADNTGKCVVIKTLFKSGKPEDLDEIQTEKSAVEFLKNKPQNNHMVFPTEYFEDNNFLFVVYPFVPLDKNDINLKISSEIGIGKLKGAININGFEFFYKNNGEKFKSWNDVTKKKFIWNIAKQLFEIYKYFCENKFYHDDMETNVLIQLNRIPSNDDSFSFDDFTLKVIDWGRYYKSSVKPGKTPNYPYEPMMSEFVADYNNIKNYFLYPLYESLSISVAEHKKSNGDDCEYPEECCKNKFFDELDKFFGLNTSSSFCKALGEKFKKFNKNFISSPPKNEEFNGWVKDFKFAQNFDDLIKFCQDQIDKLK